MSSASRSTYAVQVIHDVLIAMTFDASHQADIHRSIHCGRYALVEEEFDDGIPNAQAVLHRHASLVGLAFHLRLFCGDRSSGGK